MILILSALHLHSVLLINSSHYLSRCDTSHILSYALILIHLVMPSVAARTSSEHALQMKDLKHIVHLLHTALHLPEHHLLKERQLLEKLDHLKQELSPLEKVLYCLSTAFSKWHKHVITFLERHLILMLSIIVWQIKAQLSQTAEFKASRALWTGLAILSVQGGALAWLTWWVYSWDVMEPVTYFLTYSTSIGIFAYYVLTKQASVTPGK